MTKEDKNYLKTGFDVVTWQTNGSLINKEEGILLHCVIRNTMNMEKYKVQTKSSNYNMPIEDFIKASIDMYFSSINNETQNLIKIDYPVGNIDWYDKIIEIV